MWPNTPFPPPSRAMKPSDWTPCFADQVNDLMDKRADLSFPSPSDTHSPTCFFGLPPRMGSIRSSAVRFAADSAPEGDGFEPSVPHKKTTLFGCPRSVPQFAFRNKNRLFRAGTDGSNPSPSSSESGANLQTPLAVRLLAQALSRSPPAARPALIAPTTSSPTLMAMPAPQTVTALRVGRVPEGFKPRSPVFHCVFHPSPRPALLRIGSFRGYRERSLGAAH